MGVEQTRILFNPYRGWVVVGARDPWAAPMAIQIGPRSGVRPRSPIFSACGAAPIPLEL